MECRRPQGRPAICLRLSRLVALSIQADLLGSGAVLCSSHSHEGSVADDLLAHLDICCGFMHICSSVEHNGGAVRAPFVRIISGRHLHSMQVSALNSPDANLHSRHALGARSLKTGSMLAFRLPSSVTLLFSLVVIRESHLQVSCSTKILLMQCILEHVSLVIWPVGPAHLCPYAFQAQFQAQCSIFALLTCTVPVLSASFRTKPVHRSFWAFVAYV